MSTEGVCQSADTIRASFSPDDKRPKTGDAKEGNMKKDTWVRPSLNFLIFPPPNSGDQALVHLGTCSITEHRPGLSKGERPTQRKVLEV